MDAQILLVFRIAGEIQGRLAADIMNGKPDRFLGELCSGQDIPLQELVDSIAGKDRYRSLPVPAEYAKPEKAFNLRAVLDLTEHTLLVAGSYRIKPELEAAVVLSFGLQPADARGGKDAPVRIGDGGKDREPAKRETEYAWWLGAQLKNFALSDISSALEGVERFLGIEKAAAAVVLSSIDQKIPAGKETSFLRDIGGVRKGLTFQIEAAFGDVFLKEALDIQGSCRISGYIPPDRTRAVELSGHGDKMVFLQFLSLTDIELCLKKHAGEKRFSFSVSGDLALDFPQLHLPKVRAGITYEENQGGRRLLLRGEFADPVINPLGIPKTELEQVAFTAVSKEFSAGNTVDRSEEFAFQGRTVIGGVEIAAAVYFTQRQPAVVEMTVGGEQRLSISTLTEKYFDFSWLDILDIQLYSGRLWYCRESVAVGGTTYRAGFHAQLDAKIFFLPECTLSIDIDGEEELVAGARVKEAAELAFVRFYTRQGQQEYGPQIFLRAAKEKTVFVVSSCVAFFSEEIGQVEIAVGKERMEGSFLFPDGLPLSGRIGFYADENGLSLGVCSVGKMPRMDFDLPKMNLGDGKCKVKVLGGLKFKAVPKVESKEFLLDATKWGAKFDFAIQIKSETSFRDDGGDDFVTLPFRDLEVEADKDAFCDFRFETFVQILADNIAGLVGRMAEQVISGEIFEGLLTEEGLKRIARFLTIAGITWGIDELVSYLVCKGLKKLLADAFVAALTGVQESLWEGLGFSLMLGGILGNVGSGGTYTPVKKAPSKNGKEPGKNPQTPGAPQVFFRNEKLTIRWEACEGAQGYRALVSRKLSGSEGQEIMLVVGKNAGTVCEIAGSDAESLYLASYGFEYRIGIYAWNSGGAAQGQRTSIYLLKRPQNMRLRYQCERRRLCLTWDFVEKAEQYEVEWRWQEAEETRRESATYGATAREAACENQEPGQTVEVFLRGKAHNVVGPVVGSGSFRLYDLRPPEKIEGYPTDYGIALEWTRVPYAARYRVSCLDDAGGEIEAPICRGTRALIGAEKIRENVWYAIRIQPMTEEIEGWRSEEVRVLWRLLPTPQILEFVCRSDGLMTAVLLFGNRKCRQMIYPNGRVIALDRQPAACEWSVGKEARVRLVERARQGKWSRAVCTEPVKAPENVQASVEGNVLCVRWKETEDARFYGIEAVAGENRLAEEMFAGTVWQADISRMRSDAAIRVCLYAIDGTDPRRRSVSVECFCTT